MAARAEEFGSAGREALGEAIERLRPYVADGTVSLSDRVRGLWAAVVVVRAVADAGVIEAAFMRLARDTGLFRDLGRHADEDLRHVIRWGILDRDPFGRRRGFEHEI